MSRRVALGSSGLAVLGLLAGSAPGQTQGQQPQDPEEHDAAIKARLDQRKAFGERMRNAGSREERLKMMEEMRAMDRQRAIEEFKCKLRLSDQEWAVLKPRIETVYNLVPPHSAAKAGAGRERTDVEQRSGELRAVLDATGTETSQIKTKLAALRVARDRADRELAKARHGLRQLMTLRQEAELVLCGLLD